MDHQIASSKVNSTLNNNFTFIPPTSTPGTNTTPPSSRSPTLTSQCDTPRGRRYSDHDIERRMNGDYKSWFSQNPRSPPIWLIWIGISLVATALTMDNQTVFIAQTYALSHFQANAYIGLINSSSNFVNVAVRPIIANFINVHGTLMGYGVALGSLILGFVLSAVSIHLSMFIVGQCLYNVGVTSLMFLQQIVSAQNSSLKNRALATTIPLMPFFITIFTTAPIVNALLPDRWRMMYAMWGFILPVSAIPLVGSLYVKNQRTKESVNKVDTVKFDTKGIQLLLLGLGLAVLSSTAYSVYKATVLYIILGCGSAIVLCIFVRYELGISDNPLLNFHLAKYLTVSASSIMIFCYWFAFTLYQPYYYTYLVIAQDMPITTATNAGLSSVFSATACGLAISIVVKYTGRLKWVLRCGAIFRIIGGLALLLSINSRTIIPRTFAAQIFYGGGLGFMAVVVNTAVQAAVNPADIPSVTALYTTCTSIGAFAGDLVSTNVYSRVLLMRLLQYLPESARGNATHIKNSIMVAKSYARGTLEREAIDRSYVEAMRVLQIIAFVAFCIAGVVCFMIKDIILDEKMERQDSDDEHERTFSAGSDETDRLLA